MEYQPDYSQRDPSLFNADRRRIKAAKIVSVIEDFLKSNLKTCICLDIGCAAGVNTNYLGSLVKESVGIEYDTVALKAAHASKGSNVTFFSGDAMHLPFRNDIFDIVICNHIYEHVPDAQILMNEIFRILKPGGICYFGATNRFCIIEPHYNLWFLSWLPKPIANLYLLLLKRKVPYYETLKSYFGLRNLFSQFYITDYTISIIMNPDQYHAIDMIEKQSLIRYIPRFFLTLLLPLIPTYIFVLVKPHK